MAAYQKEMDNKYSHYGPKQIEWKQRFVAIIIPIKHWNWIVEKQNDSNISHEWSFQWNVGIILQVKCCYHFVTHLSWVLWLADSAQMSKKTITAVYLKNDYSISLECSFNSSEILESFWK